MTREWILISDIHANIDALDTVLKDVRDREKRHIPVIFLGDLIGRGPSPVEVFTRLEELRPVLCLRGNHDDAAIEPPEEARNESLRNMEGSRMYQILIQAHRAELGPDRLARLAGWPIACANLPNLPCALFMHARPDDSVGRHLGSYTDNIVKVRRQFADPIMQDQTWGFFGHTHLQEVYHRLATGRTTNIIPKYENGVGQWPVPPLGPGEKMFVNPGSVGQPKLHASETCGPHADYAKIDFRDEQKPRIYFRRVPYNSERTARLMQEKYRALMEREGLLDEFEKYVAAYG